MPVGGRFSLPAEFDIKKFASAFYEEGNEQVSMEAEQRVLGTPYMAAGWQIWKYPAFINGTKTKHPKAGKPHRVSSNVHDKPDYVLMFRCAEVQKAVSKEYGELSRRNMVQEISGNHVSAGGDDPGMLSEKRLQAKIGEEGGDGTDDPGSAAIEHAAVDLHTS